MTKSKEVQSCIRCICHLHSTFVASHDSQFLHESRKGEIHWAIGAADAHNARIYGSRDLVVYVSCGDEANEEAAFTVRRAQPRRATIRERQSAEGETGRLGGESRRRCGAACGAPCQCAFGLGEYVVRRVLCPVRPKA
jgi:hypothetical protein